MLMIWAGYVWLSWLIDRHFIHVSQSFFLFMYAEMFQVMLSRATKRYFLHFESSFKILNTTLLIYLHVHLNGKWFLIIVLI